MRTEGELYEHCIDCVSGMLVSPQFDPECLFYPGPFQCNCSYHAHLSAMPLKPYVIGCACNVTHILEACVDTDLNSEGYDAFE